MSSPPVAHDPYRLRRVGARLGTGLWLTCLYVFLYLPLLITVVFSFSASEVETLPWSGFTTDWYGRLADNVDMLGALRYSFEVAALSVLVAVVCGTALALALDAMASRWRGLLTGFVVLPLVLPGIVLGLSLLALFREIGLELGLVTVVIGHASFVTPVVMLIVLTRLRQLDPSLAQASRDLGAGPLRTFWHVTLPSLRVALLAGGLLAFTMSFDEVATTVFLAGTDTTLPVFVWNLVRFGFTPEVNAVFSIIAVVSVALIVVSSLLLVRMDSRGRLAGLR